MPVQATPSSTTEIRTRFHRWPHALMPHDACTNQQLPRAVLETAEPESTANGDLIESAVWEFTALKYECFIK